MLMPLIASRASSVFEGEVIDCDHEHTVSVALSFTAIIEITITFT